MDMFMDKLAQKLTAQEMIKANTAADTEELNRLKSRVADYNECLEKLQKLIDEGSAKLENVQTVNGSEINRLVEESIQKIKALQQDTRGLEQLQKALTEQLDAMDKNISARLEETLKSQSGEQLSEKLDGMEENVHRECVKVYRNVQAVIVEENGKQNTMIEEMGAKAKSAEGKAKLILGISVGTLIVSLIGTILQILNTLNIQIF